MHKKNILSSALFILIVITGATLRFYNLNWDLGNFFHPDERNIANAVSRISFFNQLNPQFFAYGGLLIYLDRALGELLFFVTKNHDWVSNWAHINIVGRFLGAFFSTLTIPIFFFLTKKITHSTTAAYHATIISACTVGFIQTSHFGITENLLTLLVSLIALFSLKLYESPTIRAYIFLAIFCGLAVATKTTGITFLIIPAATMILITVRNKQYIRTASHGFLFTIVACLIFFIFSPYTLLDYPHFSESMRYESGVALGTLPVPYTLQFTNTTPYLYQLKNFFWQLGPIALISYFGFLLFAVEGILKKKPLHIIFLLFPLIYFLYVGTWHTKFIRFMMPTLPFLIVFASFGLMWLQRKWGTIGKIIVSIFLGITVFWSLAFFSIYLRPQTRVVASEWIYSNIPKDSKLLTEQWDDGLPIPLRDHPTSTYIGEQLIMYDTDSEAKMNYLADKLASYDYIILNSRRLYGTLIYLPNKYPLTSQYYEHLFNESLGYKQVKEFSSYPQLFGLIINDDSSEETFQVYEHPKVIIFKNEKRYSKEKLFMILENKN